MEDQTNGQQISPVSTDKNLTSGDSYKLGKDAAKGSGFGMLKKLLGSKEVEDANKSGSGNSFTALFGNASPEAKPQETKSLASLLGPKPSFSKKVMQEQEQKRVSIAKGIFIIVLLSALGTFGFFYSQLNANFTWFSDWLGPNVSANFQTYNEELAQKQTLLNNVRYRKAMLLLDEVNSRIDTYQAKKAVLNSPASTASQKLEAESQRKEIEDQIKASLTEVQKILNAPLGIDTYSREPITPQQREDNYKARLKDSLMKTRSTVTNSGEKPNQEQLRILDNVIRLVDSESFKRLLKGKDFGKISLQEFEELLERIREEGTDEISLINKIRQTRLDWAQIIQDIHTAVMSNGDSLYGQGLFRTVGGFLFNSYRFDAKTGRISISGITKTADSKTFSTISNLIDSIECSAKFKDIDFRSFSKNKDEGGFYSSSLNLDFALQSEPDPDRDCAPTSVTPPGSNPAISEPNGAGSAQGSAASSAQARGTSTPAAGTSTSPQGTSTRAQTSTSNQSSISNQTNGTSS